MRTILRDGLDRYEVLRADEPLRRGERLVRFSDQRTALAFLQRVGGPADRDLRRLAWEDFAGEFSGVTDARLAAELAERALGGRLKIVQVLAPPPRLRGTGSEYLVLERMDRPRRGEAPVKVWDETSAFRFARLLATMPAPERSRLPQAAALRAGSQSQESRTFSRLLVAGHIRIVRLDALRTSSGGGAPPDPGGKMEAQGFGWRDAASVVAGFVPGVSDLNDLATVITGHDAISGEDVSLAGRAAALIGMVTPFSGGQIRAAGKLFRMRKHAVDQAIERGVSEAAIRNALENPIKRGAVRLDSQNRPSQTVMGRDATVVVNPETDDIVTVYPTSTKRREKAILESASKGDVDD